MRPVSDSATDPRDLDGTWATGRQWHLQHGDFSARIAECGAALAELRIGDDLLTEPTAADTPAAAGNGQLLVPWPNRVRDGRWTHEGALQQLALSEPARGHASHGLLRHAAYRCVAQSADRVSLQAEVFPVTGYPFRLGHRVTWSLSEHGLSARHDVTHHGSGRAPVALGAHPYLRVGDVPVADCTLTLPAATRWLLDDRLIPTGSVPVSGTHDWRAGRRIGTDLVDGCWTDLSADADGLVRYRLAAPDGRAVTLWAEPVMGQVQVYVTDRLPGRDRAVAVEPMTAPANAFNTGTGLVRLNAHETLTATWGITPSGF